MAVGCILCRDGQQGGQRRVPGSAWRAGEVVRRRLLRASAFTADGRWRRGVLATGHAAGRYHTVFRRCRGDACVAATMASIVHPLPHSSARCLFVVLSFGRRWRAVRRTFSSCARPGGRVAGRARRPLQVPLTATVLWRGWGRGHHPPTTSPFSPLQRMAAAAAPG